MEEIAFHIFNFPSQVLTGFADSIALLDTIAFENEATAPLVQAEIEKNGVHMIGSMPGGSNAFITKTEYTSLDDMKGLKLGIGMNQSAMEIILAEVAKMINLDVPEYAESEMAAGGDSAAGESADGESAEGESEGDSAN